MTKDGRHVYGPRTLSSLLPAITRPALRSRNAAAAQLIADWETVVGPALAGVTLPRRLSAGTLTLACAGPMALELQHQSQLLIGRINGHYGRLLVDRLRFVQDETAAVRTPPPVPRAAPLPVEIPDMPEGPLRDALAALGGQIARRRQATSPDGPPDRARRPRTPPPQAVGERERDANSEPGAAGAAPLPCGEANG